MSVALTGVSLVAWALMYVMSDPERGVSDVLTARPWGPHQFAAMLLMWVIMMIGMMVPSAIPLALTYAMVVRREASQGRMLTPTAVVVLGYVAIWGAFSVVVTLIQWRLHRAALLSESFDLSSVSLGAGLLIAAGLYQLTPLKDACLRHCRSPANFIATHWRSGLAGAFRMGAEHGLFCVGCCWVLMMLLFVGGIMNLVWIILITAFVLVEKVASHGVAGGRLVGVTMIVVGSLMLAWDFAEGR